jgi:hypothetical protein
MYRFSLLWIGWLVIALLLAAVIWGWFVHVGLVH